MRQKSGSMYRKMCNKHIWNIWESLSSSETNFFVKYKVAKLITVPVKLSRTSAAQVKQKTNHRLTQSCQLQTEDAERCSKLKFFSKVIPIMYFQYWNTFHFQNCKGGLGIKLIQKVTRFEQGYRPFYCMSL